MLEMCLEQCYYVLPMGKNGLPTLPEWATVEHLDHRKQHNCRQNLMMLDKRIHDAISLDHGNMRRAMYRSIVDVVVEVQKGEEADFEYTY
jgi:hypothetical protein